MTARLPLLSSEELVAALRIGKFEALRKSKGSHLMMVRPSRAGHDHVVVVLDQREVPRGTLRRILKQGNIPEEEFLKWVAASKRRGKAPR